MFIEDFFLQQIKNGERYFYLLELINTNRTLRFTTNDVDVKIDGYIYKSNIIQNEIKITNIEQTNVIEVQFLKNDEIIVEDLINCSVNIKLSTINHNILIFTGFISSINCDNSIISLSIYSQIEKLNQSIGQLFSPICRECIGNKKCGIDINNYKSTGTVLELYSQDCFLGTHYTLNPKPIGYYRYGLIKFLSGKLCGITMQIKDEENGVIYLLKNTKLLKIGDVYEIFAGCDKTFKTCKEKFHNSINFRGEPYINNSF